MPSYDKAKTLLADIRAGSLAKAADISAEMAGICKAGDKRVAWDLCVNALFAIHAEAGDVDTLKPGFDAIVASGFDAPGALLALFKANAAQVIPMRDFAESNAVKFAMLTIEHQAALDACTLADQQRKAVEEQLRLANQQIAALQVENAGLVGQVAAMAAEG